MQIKCIWKNMPPILSLVCFVEELGMLLPMAIVSCGQTKCLTMQDCESYMYSVQYVAAHTSGLTSQLVSRTEVSLATLSYHECIWLSHHP